MAEKPTTISGHTAYIYDRGGRRRIHKLYDLDLCRWNRVRDDISEATIHLNASSASAQAEVLNEIEPGRHELVLFRGTERVWEGPITLPTFTSSGVTIGAKDVMYYVYRTIMHAGYDSSYGGTTGIEYVTSRSRRILQAELARKESLDPPINVLPYLVEHHSSTDAQTSRVTLPYEMTVWEHIDDMAAKAGMDYVVVGRAIHLWDTSRGAMGQTRTATESDFLSDVYVSVYGSELATSATVTDGQGNFATAGTIDPYYGEWEVLATAYDETDKDATIPTSAELYSQAERNLAGRNPTPLQIRVPDGSTINPNGVLQMKDLVPGVYVPVRAKLNIRQVSQMQKLSSVKVEETPTGENISVTFYPASQSDETGDESA